MQKTRDARNERLLEEARITQMAVNSGFSGEEKPMQALEDAYMPEALKEERDQQRIGQSARRLQQLFGG